MRHLIALVILLTLLASDSYPQARSRKKTRPKSKTKVEKIEEAQALAELEWIRQEEATEIARLDTIQKSTIIFLIEKLSQAGRIYKVTGEIARVEADFYTIPTVAALTQTMETLPEGQLRDSIADAVLTLGHAIKLHNAYYGLEDVSTDKILEIVGTHEIENVGRHDHVRALMGRFSMFLRNTGTYARRAGLNVKLK